MPKLHLSFIVGHKTKSLGTSWALESSKFRKAYYVKAQLETAKPRTQLIATQTRENILYAAAIFVAIITILVAEQIYAIIPLKSDLL